MPGAWQRLLAEAPQAAELFADDPDGTELAEWLDSARALVGNYFALEDPRGSSRRRVRSWSRSSSTGCGYAATSTGSTSTPAGDIRVVDYKTGTTPREAFEAKALFQMKFYALVLWRTRGVVPRQLRLMYLADTDTLTYAPDADELERFERTLQAIWAAIERATRPASSGRARAGCAPGAITRCGARPSAARRRRSRSMRSRPRRVRDRGVPPPPS